ncbi:conserved hypothetical protein [Vibrio chagasii]|nr:conserved hypothetical protein [Vibrio chagasii]
MKSIITSADLQNISFQIQSVENSGFDLILTDTNGGRVLVEDGLTKLITSKVSLTLVNGNTIDYKDIVKDLVNDSDSVKLLDTHFIGDVHERLSGDHEGTGVEESEIQIVASDEEAEDSVAEDDQMVAMQAMLDALQKALDELEIDTSLDSDVDEKDLAEQIEQLTEALESRAEKSSDAVEDMKSELDIEEVEVNNNTSTLSGEFDVAPSSGNSSKSGASNILEEGEPKPEDSFTVSLDSNSDSGAKGDWITNVGEPVFIGTGTAGTVVTIRINGGTYTTIVGGDGNWKMAPIPNLPEGDYSYTATDSTGRTVSGTIIIDQTNTLTQGIETDTGVSDEDQITSESRVVFIGTTDPGSTVIVKINGREFKAVANANGDWRVDIGFELDDGEYDYEVISTDIAGNVVTENGTVVIDTVVDFSARLHEDDDTGWADDDGITSKNENITFVGHLEHGAEAYFEFNGVRYPVQITEDGTWSVTIEGPLDDGVYEYKLYASDIAGNEDEIVGEIVVDTETWLDARLDADSDSGDFDDDGITNVFTPYFSGNGEAGARVTLYIDGKEYSTIVEDDNTWKVQVTTPLNEGKHDWVAEIEDAAGNKESDSGTVQIEGDVDISVELVTDTGISDSDGITNETENEFEGITKPNSHVTLIMPPLNGGRAIDIDVNADGTFSFKSEHLEDGTYTYTFYVVDIAGNKNETTGTVTIDTETFVDGGLDAGSDSGESDSDGITNVNRPNFSGTGEAGATITVFINNKEYKGVVQSDGTWSIRIDDVIPDGVWDYRILAVDIAGNEAETSGTIEIDTIAPTDLTYSLDNDSGESDSDGITKNGKFEMSGTVEAGCDIRITIGSNVFTTNNGVVVNSNGTWTFVSPIDFGEGDYTIVIEGIDVAGNVARETMDVVVDKTTWVDGGLDSDSDSGDSDSDGLTNIDKPWFSGTGEPDSKIVLVIDGKTYETTTDEMGRWSVQVLDALTDDVYRYEITITDKAGNTESISGEIEIDTIPPEYIEYNLENDSGFDSNDFITNENSPHLTGKTEAGASMVIKFHLSDGTVLEFSSPRDIEIDSNGNFELLVPNSLPDGTHRIEFIATDKAGNSKTEDQTLVIDTQIWVEGGLDPESDTGTEEGVTNDTTPTFAGRGDAGDKITLTINNRTYETVVNADGTWSVKVEDTLPQGVLTWTIEAVDAAGNERSVTGSVEIDTETWIEGGLDSGSDSGSSSSDGITNVTTPEFSGRGEAGATVTLTINGREYSTVIGLDERWSIDVDQALEDDTYTYVLEIVDGAGNKESLTDTITIKTTTWVEGGLDSGSDSGEQGDSITNVKNPDFSGTGEAGSVVKLVINGREYSTVVGDDGKWIIDNLVSLDDNDYPYTISVVDIAGNESETSGELTIKTSTWVEGGLDPEFDSGASDSDDITNKDVLEFMGTGEVGATIVLRIANQNYTTTVDSDGNWRIDGIRALSDGSYDYTITTTDIADNEAQVTGTVTIDTLPPEFDSVTLLNDSGHSDSDFITKNGALELAGSTEDPSITLVIRIGGNVYNSGVDFDIREDGSWTFTMPTTLSDGTYQLELTYTDLAGNKSTEDQDVVVDTTNFVTGELHPDSDSGTADNITNINTPTFRGETDPFSKVTLTIGGNEYVVYAGSDGLFTIDVTDTLNDGIYDWVITSEDVAGNVRDVSGSVEIDTIAPSLDDVYLLNDSNIDDDWVTQNSKLELAGKVEKDAQLTLVLTKGGERFEYSSPSDFTLDEDGNWSFTLPMSLSDGEWNLELIASDLAGNTSNRNIDIVVDTVIDADGILRPEDDTGWDDNDGVTSVNTPTFIGSGEYGATLILTVGGNDYDIDVNPDGSWSFQISPALEDGLYEVSLYTIDLAGNEKTISLQDLVIDTIPPESSDVELVSDSGVQGDWITNVDKPIFSGKIEVDARIEFTINGVTYRNADMSIDSEGNWTLELPSSLPDNTYAWSLVVSDRAGNESKQNGNVEIDTIIELEGGLDPASDSGEVGDDLTNHDKPIFSGVTDAGATVTLTINGKQYTEVADSNGRFTILVTDALPDDTYLWELHAIDPAGNEKVIEGEVEIDTTLPEASIELINDTGWDDSDGITNETRPVFGGVTEVGAEIKVVLSGVTYTEPVIQVDSNGNWSLVIPSDLIDGKYTVDLIVTDKADNVTRKQIEIEIDTETWVEGGLDASSDTGDHDDDGITKDETPKFSGKGEAGARVTLIINGKEYSTIVNEDETWEVDVTDRLTDGTHSYEIWVEDAAGNRDVERGSVTIKTTTFVDGDLDSASDSGASDSDGITNVTKPTFVGKTDPLATVTFTIDNASHEVIADQDGNWVFTLDYDLTDGTYEWSISTSDIAGNVAHHSGEITINTETWIDGGLDPDSDSGEVGDDLTNDNKPVFSGNGEAGATVTLTINGKSYSTVVSSDETWSLQVTDALPDEVYDWTIVIEDIAGNTAPISGEIEIDTTTFIEGGLDAASDTGHSDSDGITNVTTPSFSGNSEAGATVTLVINNRTYSTIVNSDGTWFIETTDALTDGDYSWTLSVVDKAENEDSITGSITVETTNFVTAMLDSDSDSGTDEGVTSHNRPTFTGTGKAGARVTLIINDKEYTGVVDANGNWSVTVTDQLPDDVYNWKIISEDVAGNFSEAEGVIEIDTVTWIEGGLDADSDSGDFDDDDITNEERPWFSGRGEPNSHVSLVIDGREYFCDVDSEGNWEVRVDFRLSDGIHDYILTITDGAGNTEVERGSIEIITSTAVDGELDIDSDSGDKGDDVTNVTTPWFSGTGDAGATITFTINNRSYETVVGEDGKWRLQVEHELNEDKVYHWTIVSNDIAGNEATKTGSIEIDTVTEVTARLDADSDTGDSDDDGLTNINTPWFSGTGEVGAQIILYINSREYSTVVASDGTWRVQVEDSLIDGSHVWQVEATDHAGNKDTAGGTVDIDTVTWIDGGLDPDSDTGTEDGVTSVDKPTFSGTGEAGATVTLTINSKSYSVVIGVDETWSITVEDTLPDGTYNWVINSVDAAGNPDSLSGTVEVDTVTFVTARLDADSDSGDDNGDGLTNVNRPWFSGTGEAGATVTLYINDNEYSVVVDSDETWRLQVSDLLPDDTYSWRVEIVDGAGNRAEDEGEIEIDTVVWVEGGLDEASDTGTEENVTSDTSPTFSGRGEAGAKITLTINDQVFTTYVNEDSTWTLKYPDIFEDGVYDWSIVIEDAAGNSQPLSGEIEIDTVVTIDGGLDSDSDSGDKGDDLTNVTTPWFSGTGESGATVTLVINGKSYSTVVDANGNWRIEVEDNLPDETYVWKLTIVDGAGNTDFVDGTLTIKTTTYVTGRLAPESDSGDLDDDGITNSKEIFFVGTGEAGSTIVFTINGVEYETVVASDGTWRVDVGELPSEGVDGTSYDWSVVVTDKAGNTATDDGVIVVDTVPPEVPTVELDDDSDSGDKGDWVTKESDITLHGTAEFGSKLTVNINSVTYDVIVASDGTWSLDVTGLIEGDYVITIVSTDKAGNATTTTQDLAIDQTNFVNGGIDPDSDEGTSNSDGITCDDRPDMSGKTDPLSSIRVVIKSSTGETIELTTVADESGNWFISGDDWPYALGEGVYDYTIYSVDPAGNEADYSNKFEIDTTINLTLELDDLSNSGSTDDSITNHTSPRVSGKVDVGDFVEVLVIDADGNTVERITATVLSDGNWYADTTTSLTDGFYTFRAIATDVAGNRLVKNIDVEIDTIPPEDLTVELHADSDTGDSGNWITQDNTPRFIGTIEPGCTVELTINLKTYYAQVDSNGNWELLVTDTLPDGTWNWSVVSKDVAGNESKASGEITIDNTNFLEYGLMDGHDTGWDDDDGITSESKPIYEGSTDPFSTVVVTVVNLDPPVSITINVDHTGEFSFEFADFFEGNAVPDGEYNFTIISTDPAGNVADDNGSITVDTIDPTDLTVSLDENSDSGEKGDWITNDSTPVFVGTVEAGVRLWVEIDNVTHQIQVNEDGTWSIGLPQLGDGVYEWRVWAEDAAGNRTTERGSIEIDTIPPTDVSGRLDASCDTGIQDDDGVTKQNSNLVFSGTTEVGTTIVIRIEGVDYPAVVSSDGTWAVTIDKTWTDGTYRVDVIATDKAGNVNDDVNFEFTVDTIPPEITDAGLHPDDDHGDHDDDNITNENSPRIIGQGSTDIVRVYIIIDGTSEKIYGNVNSDGTFEIKLSDLPDGVYTYTVFAEDRAGNTVESGGHEIEIDTLISLDASLDEASDSGIVGDWITNDENPRIVGKTEVGNRVKLEIKDENGNVVFSQEITTTTTDFSFTVSPSLAEGRYTFKIEARDVAGNYIPQEGELTIKMSSVIEGGMDAGSDTGIVGDDMTNQSNPTFSGSTDRDSTIIIRLTGSFNGMHETREYTATSDSNGNWSFRIPDTLSDGDYSYDIWATDYAANESNRLTGDITVDLTPPDIEGGILTDTGSSDSDGITSGVEEGEYKGHLDFQGRSDSEDIWRIQIYINGKTYEVPFEADGSFTFVLPDKLPDGTYSYNIIAWDEAGNKTELTNTVVLDTVITTTPGLDVDSDSGDKGDNLTNVTRPVISGRGEANLEVSARLTGHDITVPVDLGSTVADEEGNWSFDLGDFLSMPLTDGVYVVEFDAKDPAGNTGTFTYTFTIDTIPPALDINEYNGTEVDTNRPLISGTAEANAYITLKIDNETYTLTADSAGNWAFDPSDFHMLPDGEIHYTIIATDAAGNSTEKYDYLYVNTGTYVEGGLDSEDDTGAWDNDGITQVRTPNFKGIGEANAEIRVLIYDENGNIIQILETVVDRNGMWNVRVPDENALLDGRYTYIIEATDRSGNVVETEEQDLVIDNSIIIEQCIPYEPSYGATSAEGQYWLGHQRFYVQGKLADNDANARVVVTIDGVEYVGYTDESGSYSIYISLPDGIYDVHVAFTDAAGNETDTSFKIDIDSDTSDWSFGNDDDLSGVDDGNYIVNTASPIFSGTADPDNGRDVRLELYGLTNYSIVHTLTRGESEWEFTFPDGIADGSYSYYIVYYEMSGRYSTARGSLVVDTSNEILTVESLERDVNESGDWTSTTMSGFAEGGAEIVVTVNGQNYVTKASAGGAWSIDLPIDSNGIWELEIVSTDAAYNEIKWSDNNPPYIDVDFIDVLEVDVPEGGEFNPNTHTLSGRGDKGLPLTIKLTDENGVEITKYVSVNNNGTWTVDLKDVEDGYYTFVITGTSNWDQVSINGDFILNSSAPVIEDIVLETDTGEEGDWITSVNNPTFSGKVSDDTDELIFEIGGVQYFAGQDFVLNSDGTFVFTVPLELNDGTYDFKVIARDSIGNESVHEGDVTIINDLPELEEIVLVTDSGEQGDWITNITSPVFTGKVPSTVTEMQIKLDDVYYEAGKDFILNADGTWRFSPDIVLADGHYTLTIYVVDVAGNENEFEIEFEIDTMPPEMEGGLSPDDDAGDGVTSSTTPTFSGTGEVGAKVVVTINGVDHSTIVDEEGNWSLTWPTDLPEGQHLYVFYAEDAAGNRTELDYGLVTVDTTPPELDGSVVSNDEGFTDSNPVFEGTSEAGAVITIIISGVEYTTVADGNGDWSFTWPDALEDKHYEYEIFATDKAGNQSESIKGEFVVDTIPPEDIEIHTITDDSESTEYEVNEGVVEFSGTASAGDIITVTIEGISGDLVVDSSGEWNAEIELDDEGIYGYEISITYSDNVTELLSHGTVRYQSTEVSSEERDFVASLDGSTDVSCLTDSPVLIGISDHNSQVSLTIDGQTFETVTDDHGHWMIEANSAVSMTVSPYELTQMFGGEEFVMTGNIINTEGLSELAQHQGGETLESVALTTDSQSYTADDDELTQH